MGFIKNFLNKISCCHEYEFHTRTSTFEKDESIRPYKVEEILICKKCGKIKRIEL